MDHFIPYPKAIQILVNKHKASPEELAMWVWMGPKDGGLSAYLNANELSDPPRFFYDSISGESFDFVSPLMECWFLSDEITTFTPVDHFITGTALIERWRQYSIPSPEAYVAAKIRESQLYDNHPIFGGSRISSEDDSFPPLSSAMFDESEVKQIEIDEMGKVEHLHSNERDRRLQSDANKLAKDWINEGCITFSKRDIANALGSSDTWMEMTADRIVRILRVQW